MAVIYQPTALFRSAPHVNTAVVLSASVVVKNIHYNLVAWSSSTFTLGQRCSTGGSAYQCTTAGSSTSAPTGTGSGINNGGVAVFRWLSLIDYTTIGAWATALPATLHAPQECHIWTNYSGATTTAGTPYLNTLTGHTTKAGAYIKIRAAPGESFRDQGTGNALAINTTYALFQLPAGTGSTNYFSIADNFVTVEGLQFLDPDATSGSTIVDVPGTNATFIGCLFDGYAQTGGASMISFDAAAGAIDNCLVIDRQPSGGGQLPTVFGSAGTGKATNCTFIGINSPAATSAIVCNNAGTNVVTVRNCASFGYPSGLAGTAGTSIAADHCVLSASSIGSGVTDNGGNLLSKTAANQFISATTDFRLKTGADCIGAGVADAPDISTSDDIYRTARGVSWDVGADEYVASSNINYPLSLLATDAQVVGFSENELYLRSFFASSTEATSLTKLVGWIRSAVNAQTTSLRLYTGPGDLVSGATFWYGLRGYSSSYAAPGTNPCCIVKRASDSTTQTINILPRGNLDVATLTAFISGTTGVVTTFYDQSGNGFNLTGVQATAPQILATGGAGGLPCLVFGGSDTLAGAINAVAIPVPFTAAGVVNRTGNTGSFTGVLTVGTGCVMFWENAANTIGFSTVSGSQTYNTALDGNENSVIGIANGASSFTYVNGSSASGNDGSTTIAASSAITLGLSAATACYTGTFEEMGLWPIGYSSAQVASVYTNQFNYWLAAAGIVHSLALAATDAYAAFLIKQAAIIRGAADAQATARTVLVSVIRQATDAQAASFARLVSYFRAFHATSAQAVSFAENESYFRSLLATNAQVAGVSRLVAYFRSFSAVDAQVAARTLLVSIARGAVDAQHAVLAAIRLLQRSLSATDAEAASLQRLTSIIRGATDAQSIARQLLVAIARSAADAQATSRTLAVAIIRGAADAQASSLARLASYFRILSAVDAQAASRIAAALRTKILSAVDAQVAFCVEAYNHSGIGFNQAVNAVSAETASLFKAVGKILSGTDGQASSLLKLTGAIRRAVDAQGAALQRSVGIVRSAVDAQATARAFALSVSRSATNAQATSRRLLVAIIRGALDAQASAMAAPSQHFKALGATDAQAAARVLLVSIIRGAIEAQTAARRLFVSITRAAAESQTAAKVLTVSIIRSAVDAQATVLQRGMAVIRFAVDAEVASLVASAIRAKVLSAIDTSVAFCVETFNHAGINNSQVLNAVSAQAASLRRQTAKLLAAASAEAAAFTRSLLLNKAYGATDGQASGLRRLTGLIRGASESYAAGVVRLTSIIRSAVDASSASSIVRRAQIRNQSATQGQAASLITQTAHLLALVLAETQAALLRRSTAALRGAVDAQAASRQVGVAIIRSATDTQAATVAAGRAFGRAYSTVSSEAASLRRSIGHLLAAGSGEAAGMLWGLGRQLAYPASQAANLVRLTGHALAATEAALQSLAAQKVRSLLLFAQQTQAASLIIQHGVGLLYHISLSVISTNNATFAKGFLRLLSSASTATAGFATFLHRSLPLLLRRRVVRLPPPEDVVTLPPAARRVLLPTSELLVTLPPSIRRVLLPREEDEMSDYEIYRPEPAFFSPFDPADEETFTFDWTNRAYPGDAIVFASVISVPLGLNLLGPAFIDGTLVEITVGPFLSTVYVQPVTYSLRCMVVFASGRISNYSIPFEVRTL